MGKAEEVLDDIDVVEESDEEEAEELEDAAGDVVLVGDWMELGDT